VKCGHRFEKIESFSASETKKCPKCGARAERQLSPSAIQFKGSGWYVTDYAGKKGGESGSSKGESSSDSNGSKAADSKSDAKSGARPAETKPAADKSAAKKKK